MKTFLFLFLLAISASAQVITGCVTMVWAPSLDEPYITTYKLYHHTNSAVPLTNWTWIATIPGGSTNGLVNIPWGGPHCFYLTCVGTNDDESIPSNIVEINTPPGHKKPPRNLSVLQYYQTNSP